MLKVLEHILMTWPALEPQYRDYNESIKELQSESTVELQRLALEMPDHLLNVYNQLESRVQEMVASGTLDEKRSIAYRSFLFIIIHRANTLEPTTKVERLRRFVAPVLGAWQSDNMKQSLSTFDAFCELLGLNKAQSYLANRNVYQISDWGAIELDAEGLALQEELESRIKELPLRATKSLLMNSVERLDRSSPTFQVSQALWEDGLPLILSDLLQLLSHAHASHNPDSWTGIPPESRSRVVARVLSDRFWQAGISDGSKDDFYARVVDKKGTLEGLASSIRGSIRFVRETSYALLCCMSRFDVLFYGFSQLPMPLSQALFTNSGHLSAHQHINLLQLVKYLTDDVPPELREGFLPPILGGCFQQMDAKIRTEWERIDRQQNIEAAGDDLQEEMKAESILRQASHTAVLMVAEFLDPNKQNPPPLASRRGRLPPELANDNRTYPTLRRFCLLQSNIVEPLMLFATHAIRIRDQRSCSIIIRVFRSIISEFVPVEEHTRSLARASSSDSEAEQDGQTWPIPPETATAIREYISSDVLQACVSSFHDSSFVDLQKELAILIAQIVVYYGKFTDTSRKLLLSIPNVNEQDLNRLGEFVDKPTSNTRQQRAIVLDLLKDVKGINISEMGKVPMSIGSGRDVDGTHLSKRNDRSKMTQQFMENPVQGTPVAPVGLQRADEGLDALDGISNLFDD
jgi:exportin-5